MDGSLTPLFLSGLDQNALWFYLFIFFAIFLGAIFIPTFIPDSAILVLSGVLAKNGHVLVSGLIVSAVTGAYLGYDLDYWSGRVFGLGVCRARCPRILNESRLDQIRRLMERYGSWSILISRFIPILNIPPFIAGLDSMPYRRYMVWNLLGALLYCVSLILIGYYLGGFEIVSRYRFVLLDLAILIVLGVLVYAVLRFLRGQTRK